MHETLTKLVDQVRALWMTSETLVLSPVGQMILQKEIARQTWHQPQKKCRMANAENSPTSPLCRAFQQAAFHVNWQFIYTKEEVGWHFLDNYDYLN